MRDPRFVWLGAAHVTVLCIIGAISMALAVFARRAPARADRPIRDVLSGVVLAGQAAAIARAALSGGILSDLPLQLCDVAAFAAAAALLGRRRFAYELTYFLGLGGTLQALATPDLGAGFPDPGFIIFFVGHGSVIVSAVYLTVVARLRPEPKSMLRVFAFVQAYGLVVGAIDAWGHMNYGYLCAKPAGPTLLDYLGPWPAYLGPLDVVVALSLVLCYAPFAIADAIRSRRRHRGAEAAPPSPKDEAERQHRADDRDLDRARAGRHEERGGEGEGGRPGVGGGQGGGALPGENEE
jgi:hypothetical integral membrane protein (TIGR02206 family)